MRPLEKDYPINILEGAVRSGKTWSLIPKILYGCAYPVGGRKVIDRRLEAKRIQQCLNGLVRLGGTEKLFLQQKHRSVEAFRHRMAGHRRQG